MEDTVMITAREHVIWMLPTTPQGFKKEGEDIKTKGGIFLPNDEHFHHSQYASFQGVIIAIAEECPDHINKGDILLFNQFLYESQNVCGIEFFCLKDSQYKCTLDYSKKQEHYLPNNLKFLEPGLKRNEFVIDLEEIVKN